MDEADRNRITEAVDFWVKTKLEQQTQSEAAGTAQGGTRAAVTGGRHLAGINTLLMDELESLGLPGLDAWFDRGATVPGYYRASKNWDLLVTVERRPVLALEYKSMTGSEGKNLNNRADEVIGAAQDLRRAQEHGLLPTGLKRGYVFLMEVTPEVTRPVGVTSRVGTPDPVFNQATYLDRMAIMCERLRDDGLYDMAWALGILRTPVGFVEPRESVNWDRFKNDLRLAFG
ncbi:Restriction endonuclease XhoI [Tessaracoccus bendigoensis DSM 12906]|uniref:Restriction endonuclease XhoI n=1 Tax=Tessaracoccus bendigoensis DSM 12906 TaxID=1123357 RepID=A0A1M6C1T3_9ACTN|nr:PaeR7I family type II restriction endonuclease [Tessaracoccus bendigoensis]SHI55005.1 Restriction endonuclease XhoI [Tessaracoccus bendigoensis DSM 12906]